MPAQILTGPLEVYWAPTGEAFPTTSAAPAGNWLLIGASGSGNYQEDGVVIVSNQTIEPYRPLGESGPVELLRTAEDLMVRVTINDLTLEMVRLAFDTATVTTAAGPPATKKIGLYRGAGKVAQVALLVRGVNKSPYLATVNMQFEVPICSHVASYEMAFQKSPPAGVVLEFQALVDTSQSAGEEFGRLFAQTA